MKRIVALSFSLILLAGCASQPEPRSLEDTILAAIAIIEERPLSAEADEARRAVTHFAIESDRVMIEISADILPWMDNEPEDEYDAILFASYIAGNVRYQLQIGSPEDFPYQGLLFLFHTYTQIREADPGYSNQDIEAQMQEDPDVLMFRFTRAE